MHWTSYCPHTDQILPKLPATHKRFTRSAVVLMGLPITRIKNGEKSTTLFLILSIYTPISYAFEDSSLLTGILHATETLQPPLHMKHHRQTWHRNTKPPAILCSVSYGSASNRGRRGDSTRFVLKKSGYVVVHGWGTTLQARRSQVRFPIVSL